MGGKRVNRFLDQKCPVCSKSLFNSTTYRDHVNSHTGEKPHGCPVCPAKYATLSGRRWHLRSVHGQGKGNNEHSCNTPGCGKVFKAATNLKRHERAVHGEPIEARKTFKCPHCDKGYTHRGHLNEHIRHHTGERNHCCEFCGNRFHIKANLRTHVNQVHTKERSHECRVCGNRFTSRTQWTMHERSHTAVKPYKCGMCDKEYKVGSSLSYHVKTTHTGEGWTNCDLCGIRITANALKGHLRRHGNNHRHTTAMAAAGTASNVKAA